MHLHSDKAELDLGPVRPAPAHVESASGPTVLVARCKATPEAVVELQRSVGNAAARLSPSSGEASNQKSDVFATGMP